MRRPRLRPEIRLTEIPGPGRVAPFSVAFEGEVELDTELATGRFVALHDPLGQDPWDGDFRVITLTRATLDPEMASESLLGDVAWSWVRELVERSEVGAHALGGTVTRVLSSSYGSLSERPDVVDLEIRASWTPDGLNLGDHLRLWADLMATAAGLPPLPDGVAAFDRNRLAVR